MSRAAAAWKSIRFRARQLFLRSDPNLNPNRLLSSNYNVLYSNRCPWKHLSRSRSAGIFNVNDFVTGSSAASFSTSLRPPKAMLNRRVLFSTCTASNPDVNKENEAQSLLELRTAAFSNRALPTIRQVSRKVFSHLRDLDLSYYLSREAGGSNRIIDRGSLNFILSSMVFNVVPTILEWRTEFRKAMNRADDDANIMPIDSLINYEPVKYFSNEACEADRYDEFSKNDNLNMQCTVCWDCLLNCTPATVTSGFLVKPRSSKRGVPKIQSAGNQRRHESSLVGTSETTRPTTFPKPFCEWLAGIIDGDGSFHVSKQGHTSLEIIVGLEDLPLLRYIQNMISGSIKMRSGAKAYRFRLRSHLGMVKVVNSINGHIRNSARLLQLHSVCQVMNIPVILPVPLDAQSNWFAGFFDADGTVVIAMEDRVPQLSIQVTNKLLQDVEFYKLVFGGNIYFDSGRNGYYKWSVESRKDVILMLGYFKSSTFRSHQSRRFFLIEEYYCLYDLEAYKPDSIHHKAWLAFLDKWNSTLKFTF